MNEVRTSPLGQSVVKKENSGFTGNEHVALFASYSAEGSIKEHVEYYIKRLKENGFRVVLVIACDNMPGKDQKDYDQSTADCVIVRENKGFDFGSWAHAFYLYPDLYTSASCLLTNDSLFGPFNSFDRMVSKLKSDDRHDLFGLTQSNEVLPHIQSYFLYISKNLLGSEAFRYFMESIKPFTGKNQVISLYELPFTFFVQSSGFRVGAMFIASSLGIPQYANPTLIAWRKLIQQGFPFFKIQLLYNNHTNVDISGWEKTLRKAGYDETIAINYIKKISS